MLLNQVALVLALQVTTPLNGELKLLTACLQNLDTLSVVQTLEVVLNNEVQALQQLVVPHLVHKLQILLAVLQRIANQILQEILSELHIVHQVVERNLRLDHPELSQVARGVRILSTESGTEGVDLTHRQSTQLTLQLTRYGQVARLAEEVLRVVHRTLLVTRNVVQVHCGYVEHCACTLAVRAGDQRCMQIEEASIIEVLMNCVSHCVADTQNCTEGVGTGTQVSDLAQEFERVTLLLQGISRISLTVNLDLRSLNLNGLARANRLNQTTCNTQTSTRGDVLQQLLIELSHIGYDLNICHARAIVQCDECHVFVTALGAHPAFCYDIDVALIGFEQIRNFGSFSA